MILSDLVIILYVNTCVLIKFFERGQTYLIGSMLRGRIIYTTIKGEMMAASPAGLARVLSPLLWNVVMNKLLGTHKNNRHKTMGYGDDLVIMVQS